MQYYVRSIMYIKNIYFVHTFMYTKYNSLAICATYRLYTIHNTLMCMLCAVYSLYTMHTGYIINIVEVLEKIMRRMKMIDHSFERKFYGACNRLS